MMSSGRRPDRAPRGRGADRLPRLPRLADRPAQPRAAAGAPRPGARPRAPPGRRGRACSTSTSTASSSSTTRSATPPATSCSATSTMRLQRAPPRHATCSPARAATSSCCCSPTWSATRGRAPRAPRRRGPARARWPSRSRSPAPSSTSARRSASRSSRATPPTPTSCCATPTPRCTRPRPRAATRVTVYNGDPHEPLERLSMTSRLRKALDRERAGPALAADRRPARRRAAQARGAGPLAGPVPRPGDARRLHPVRRGDRVRSTAIGDWVVERGPRPGAGLGARRARPPRVTVNVSPRQLRRPDFGARLLGLRQARRRSRRA